MYIIDQEGVRIKAYFPDILSTEYAPEFTKLLTTLSEFFSATSAET